MQASSQRTWQLRLALMLILGAASVALCVAAFMWWKAPAAQAAASPEAVFVTRCNFSHRNMDDPIVFLGQHGAAHSHDFFANRSTQFDSDYQKLRDTLKGTTCVNPDDKSA